MDWDDVKMFLAVARTGSVRGAARALEVNNATISRRMHAFESSLGTRLFDRRGAGFVLTPAAREVLASAESMEREALSLERRLHGRDVGPRGSVTLTLPRLLLPAVASVVPSLALAYPAVLLTLRTDRELERLNHRDADLIVAVTRFPPDAFSAKPVGELGARVYARRDLEGDIDVLPWVAGTEELAHRPPEMWRKEAVPSGRIAARVTSDEGAHEVVRAGVGAAVLPCILGDRDPNLRPVTSGPVYHLPIWILHDPALRSLPRFRIVAEAVEEALLEEASLLSGRSPAEPATMPIDVGELDL